MDLGAGIRKALAKLTGASYVDEAAVKEAVKELQRVLISNDVNVQLVFELTKRIEKRALTEKPAGGLTNLREHVIAVVYDELAKLLGESYEPKIQKQRILMVGLFGAGKTTTIAKLARFYISKGLKVGVVAGDVHRPAAFEQLQQLAESVHCQFYGRKGATAVELAKESRVKLSGVDVIIFDSAGRSAFDEELVKELKDIVRVFEPDERFLVVSADVGQVAGKQAKEFNDAVGGLSGVIVTKMDGSGKGGGALSSVAVSGAKVAFLGTGEKPQDFEVFDAKRFVGRLVGYADLPALLEKAREMSDEQSLAKAMESGELNYDSFLAQMRSLKKMGPLKQILQMMGAYDVPDDLMKQSESKLKTFEAAVHSMTPKERTDTKLMSQKSRQARVAKGAGLKENEVRELVQNFERAQKTIKGLKKNRGLSSQLKKMAGGLKGFPGMG